jgi:hypothetical protein
MDETAAFLMHFRRENQSSDTLRRYKRAKYLFRFAKKKPPDWRRRLFSDIYQAHGYAEAPQ